MVFSNLSAAEKQAFFGLLDEYFASRPEVAQAMSSAGPGSSTHSPSARPAATPPSMHGLPSQLAAAWGNRPEARTPSPGQASQPPPPELPPSLGRVAAAAAALRSSNSGQAGQSPTLPQPPARLPPRKLPIQSDSTQNAGENEQAAPPSMHARTPSQVDRLVQSKKFGDVDLSSGKNMFMSIRHGTANKSATPPSVAPPIAPAFAPKKNNFPPPPVRRVSSNSPPSESAPTKATSPPPPPPPRPRVEEPQEQGDWAEAQYDYSSEDPNDLQIEAGQRILITERSSDDWWTGELNGRKGLVPASYVKLV